MRKAVFAVFLLLFLVPITSAYGTYSRAQPAGYVCDGPYYKVWRMANGEIHRRVKCTYGCSGGYCTLNSCSPQTGPDGYFGQISRSYCENGNRVAWFVRRDCTEYKATIRRNDPTCRRTAVYTYRTQQRTTQSTQIAQRTSQRIQQSQRYSQPNNVIWEFYKSYCNNADPHAVYYMYRSNTGQFKSVRFSCNSCFKICVQETPVVATCKYRDRVNRYSYGFPQAPVHEPQTSTMAPSLVWRFYRSYCIRDDPRHVYNVYRSNTGLYNTIKFNCLAGTRCVQLTYLRATCKRVTH